MSIRDRIVCCFWVIVGGIGIFGTAVYTLIGGAT